MLTAGSAFVALPGTSEFVISARKLGYSPVDTTVSDPHQNAIAITMRPIPQGLKTVVIRGNSGYDEYLDRTGFYRRFATRVDGTFLSREQIERRNVTEISAVLRDVSGVRVISQGGRAGKNLRQEQCHQAYDSKMPPIDRRPNNHFASQDRFNGAVAPDLKQPSRSGACRRRRWSVKS